MMFEELPHEVILAISNFLPLSDKLILITTCRHLFNLISNTNLFSNLDLRNRKESLEECLNIFKHSKSFGKQVKLLMIDVKYISDPLLSQLATIFPNIARVTTRKYIADTIYNQDRYSKGPFLQWSNTLEICNLMFDFPEASSTLKMTTFPRLTELVLGNFYTFEDKKEGFDFDYFLPMIQNAPSLKKLTLVRCALNLEFLEKIHTVCSDLKSLVLNQTHIIIKNDKLPQPVVPAYSFLSLEIMNAFCFDKNGLLLDYITKKYKCLKQLDLKFKREYGRYDFAVYYNDNNMLNYEGVVGFKKSKLREYDSIYKSLLLDFSRTLDVYYKSTSSFFLNLTKSIQSIVIQDDVFDNTLKVFTNSDMKFSNLKYRDVVKDPNQLDYINHITSLKTLDIIIKFPNQMNRQVFPSTSITKLSLCSLGGEICIDWLLSTFPSLEELYIRGGHNWTTIGNFKRRFSNQYPNLWNFVANVKSLDQKYLDFLILHAPNIREIDISVYEISEKGMLKVDNSRWGLKQLNIVFRNMNRNSYRY